MSTCYLKAKFKGRSSENYKHGRPHEIIVKQRMFGHIQVSLFHGYDKAEYTETRIVYRDLVSFLEEWTMLKIYAAYD